MGDEARIRSFLAAVRRRLRLRQLGRELAVALASSTGAALVLLLVAGGEQPWSGLRLALPVLAGLCGVAVLLALGRPIGRWRSDEPVARLVGERTGQGDALLSAVELARGLGADGPMARSSSAGLEGATRASSAPPASTLGSPALARAHVAAAADRLAAAEVRRVAPLSPSRSTLIAAGLISLAYLSLMVAARQRLSRGLAQLREPRPAAAPRSLEPLVGDIAIELTYPAHTGLPPRTIPGSSGEVLAPPGTQVVVRARPLVTIKSARLSLEDAAGQPVEEQPAGFAAGLVEGRFTVGKGALAGGGGYRFVLERTALQAKGIPRALREPEAHPVKVDPDRPPKVTLAAPADELELDGPRPVELAWSAEDDFGLGDVELVWQGPPPGSAGASPTLAGRQLLRKAAAGQGAAGRLEWDVGALHLPPGVRITYHVEARDNDAVSGPNVGTSRSYALRIYSAAEKHEELLAAEQALLDHAVNLLGDRLEAPRGGPPGAELGAKLTAAHAHTRELLAEVGKVREALDRDPVAPRDLRPALAGIATRLGRLQLGEKAPLEAFLRTPAAPAARAAAEAVSARHAAELERDVILLDDLMGRQRIEQLLAVTDQMQQARERLKGLLAEYKKSGSDAVKQEIEREIRALEEKLAELAQRAERLAGEVPDEFVNRDALEGGDLKSRLDAIRELVEKGEIDKAMEEMKRLSKALDKMVAGLESDLKGYRGDRFSAEERALGELESKLSDLEHDEREIQEQTDEVRARQRDEARRIGRERVEPFVKRARDKVADIKRRLAAIDRDQIPPAQQEDFDRIRGQVDQVGAALEQSDLEQAGEAARQSAQRMRGMSYTLRDEEEHRWTGARAGLRRAREKVDEAAPLAQQIADEIDQLLPRPGELLGPGERQRLESLAARQQALQQRTDELRRELDRRRGQSSGPPQAAGREGAPAPGQPGSQPGGGPPSSSGDGEGPAGGLRAAGEHMGRATDALRAGNPRDSSGEEGQAAEQLARMRRDIQSERRPRDGAGGSAGNPEPVRIPGADEYHAPREFRQDLLDAMKREAPREFEGQVKRYYEELVK